MTYNLVDRLRRIRHDERGFSLIFVGFGFMAMLSASMLAIDVGMFMNARAQAQNAADAGAHAGAVALALNSFTDHTANGPAVKGAMNTSKSNMVAGKAPAVAPADVTFPWDADSGQFDLVEVKVYRTAAKGNAIDTLIGRFFNHPTADITATARAVAAPANAENCVMPLTIPDKWIDKTCLAPPCSWNTLSTFDMYDSKGNLLPNPDSYVPPGQPSPTGYTVDADKGRQLVLKNNNQNKVAPSMYNPWDLPGSVGGSAYSDNIRGCNPNLVKMGDNMTPENGNMVGPTGQGINDLLAKDPGAHWDLSCNCVTGSAYGSSPRIRVVPLYDPVAYAKGQQSGKSQPVLNVVNYLGFFIEGMDGAGQVTGRITPILGKKLGNGPSSAGSFIRAIMIVK